MIYTWWGNEVQVIKGSNEKKGIVHIKYSDGSEKAVNLMDLKADGGMEEIIREINLIGKGE
uniref:Uncharacterized protein n=1 Tax=viral metagenome TaxID=1070528 RepID=A0A6M3LHL6_9ZZZZ